MKKVSMIMPCYNSATYLDNMLESIIAQTYDNVELLAAYDSSTDDTLEKLNAWKPRFTERCYELKIIENEKRLGITGGINKALPHFSGDYITFPDSDDYMFPNFVQIMVSALEENPQYRWARCDNIIVSDNDPDRILENTKAFDTCYQRLGVPLCLMLYLIPRSPWRMMAKADFFRCVFPKLAIYQHPSSHEVPLALPLAYSAEPLRVAKPLYKYILHASAYTQSRHKSLHGVIPYLDSMEIVACDCIDKLDANETIKQRLHRANRMYYLGQKAYYAAFHGENTLASDYAEMLLNAIHVFVPQLNIPYNFIPVIYWRQFFRYAANISVGIYADYKDDKILWELLTVGKLVLYGAGKNCGDILLILKDLGVVPYRIWDRNAVEIISIDGVKVDAPCATKIRDITIVITILSQSVSDSVKKNLQENECDSNILDAAQMTRALRYGMIQKYFPHMISKEKEAVNN